MKINRLLIMLISAAIGSYCAPLAAQQKIKRDDTQQAQNYWQTLKATDYNVTASLNPKHRLFQNIYFDPKNHAKTAWNGEPLLSLKEYRERFRELLSLELTHNLRIGVDKFKVNSIVTQKNQIVQIEPHLAPKESYSAADRGYGIEFRVKLD